MRFIRAAQEYSRADIQTAAVYTASDSNARYVRDADYAVRLPDTQPEVAAYLDADTIIAAARSVGATGIWLGWGFLSENADFATRCEKEGLLVLGPTAASMQRLGDKISSKQLAADVGVPLVPWLLLAEDEAIDTARLAREVGMPVIVKASAGGGGRGVRAVHTLEDLPGAIVSARNEALKAFGDGRLYVERLLQGPRHLEVQVLGDGMGDVTTFGVRDCTMQRRHQKVIEECPGPFSAPALCERLQAYAKSLCQAVNYRGVGTIEFLYMASSDEVFFIEANTRLQVEHTITELVHGVDLVKCQIDVALGHPLSQASAPRGYAIEARLCAESPERDFAPAPGKLVALDFAAGPGIRIDTSVHQGDTISASFDSMIAKIIAYGQDRTEALRRLQRALTDTTVVIAGGQSNQSLLTALVHHPDVASGAFHTRWLDEQVTTLVAPSVAAESSIAAAVIVHRAEGAQHLTNFFTALTRGVPQRVPEPVPRAYTLSLQGHTREMRVATMGYGVYRVSDANDAARFCIVEWTDDGAHRARMAISQRQHAVNYSLEGHDIFVELDAKSARFTRAEGGVVRAPAPSVVTSVLVKPGDTIHTGQIIASLEAMKTEMPLRSPSAGVVLSVDVVVNAQVAAGAAIVTMRLADHQRQTATLVWPQSEEPALSEDSVAAARAAFAGGARQARRFIASLERQLRRAVLGYDVDAVRMQRVYALLDQPDQWVSSSNAPELQRLAEVLVARGDIALLFSQEHLLPARSTQALGTPGLTYEQAFYDFARHHAQGLSAAHPAEREVLARVLNHYGIAAIGIAAIGAAATDGSANGTDLGPLRHALLRVTQAHRAVNIDTLLLKMLGFLRYVAALGATLSQQQDLYDALGRLAQAKQRSNPALCDAARDTRYLLFTPKAVVASEAPVLAAERLAAFTSRELHRDGRVAGFHVQAKSNPKDQRVIVVVQITSVRELGDGFLQAMWTLRRLLREHDPRRQWASHRVEITLSERRAFTRSETVAVARRLRLTAEGEGLEAVLVHTTSPDGRATSLSITNPTGQRIHAETLTDLTLHPMAVVQQRAQAARQRQLPYPYAIVNMLTTFTDDGVRDGEFREYDLDDSGKAIPVQRPAGTNTAAVVFGVVTHQSLHHPQGCKRVLCMSDAMLDMGALGEHECKRLLAAFDLAEDLHLPLEWIPVSSGARIAMDSGTENLDWTARVLRRIVVATQQGMEINIIVDGVNVGAQSYFNAEATMLQHCKGVLIMTPRGTMVLTGKRALDYSGSVSAEDERGIGGFDRVMGPNGQAQYFAKDLNEAYRILFAHYARRQQVVEAFDPAERNAMLDPYPFAEHGFKTVGDIFSATHNAERKKPFDMRTVMHAVKDRRSAANERFAAMRNAEGAIVMSTRLGGHAVTLIGFESKPSVRRGFVPGDGPDTFSGGTLFPASSKKVARAINAASGVHPVVVLANLSGFDGSPESLRRLQLEYGAEIGRAVVNFAGRIVFCVVGRYHGGAYVVFSKALNDNLIALAVEGSFASVIGGAPAAAVVFSREVRARALADARVQTAARNRAAGDDTESYDKLFASVLGEHQGALAKEFDAVHSVQRALAVGSLDKIIAAKDLRSELIAALSG